MSWASRSSAQTWMPSSRAENRDSFEKLMNELQIPQPAGQAVTRIEDGVKVAAADRLPGAGAALLCAGRPGHADRAATTKPCAATWQTAVVASEEHPVLVDKYIAGKELEVDAICDGEEVLIPGIMEHVERTGVHSGDSISVYPTFSVGRKSHGLPFWIIPSGWAGASASVGLFNIQFIVSEDETVHVIEVNPRSSRTVPFLSKATGIPMPKIATKVMLGHSLKEQGYQAGEARPTATAGMSRCRCSASPSSGALDAYLSPEMKSTGEAIGYDDSLNRALYKALKAAGMRRGQLRHRVRHHRR